MSNPAFSAATAWSTRASGWYSSWLHSQANFIFNDAIKASGQPVGGPSGVWGAAGGREGQRGPQNRAAHGRGDPRPDLGPGRGTTEDDAGDGGGDRGHPGEQAGPAGAEPGDAR